VKLPGREKEKSICWCIVVQRGSLIDLVKDIIYRLTPPKVRPVLSAAQNVAEILQSLVPKTLIVVPHEAGFFSNFNKVMNHLVCSLHRYGIRAIEVDWNIEKGRKFNAFFYGTHKDGNVWEHFFDPLSFPACSSIIRKKTSSYRDFSITGSNAYNLYTSGCGWRQQYHSAFKKYIRIKHHILQEVEQTYSRYLAGKYCIGVHIRNEAHKCEQPDGQMPPLERYMAEITHIISSHKEEVRIFLATDVEGYVARFKDVFGEKVITQTGIPRLQELSLNPENKVIYQYDPNLTFAEDVLKDCLLLAKCDVLIHRVSNIATAVGYINPSISMIYCR
jgi:hypothetical protein